MTYQRGEYVYPSDLGRPFLCRVVDAERLHLTGAVAQLLKLRPLEGPWPKDAVLIRFADGVRRTRGPEPGRRLARPQVTSHAA
jgi:hypothetical protein